MKHRDVKSTVIGAGALVVVCGSALSGCKGAWRSDQREEPVASETGAADREPESGAREVSQAEWMAQQRPRPGATDNGESETAGETTGTVAAEEPAATEARTGTDGGGGMTIVDERERVADRNRNRVDEARPAGESVPEAVIDLPEPKTPEERSLARATNLYAQGDMTAAIRELERAIAYNPAFTRAYIELGDIYAEMEDYERAERVYREAVRNEPRNYLAQYRHAQVLHKLGALDESRRAYLRALSVRPSAFDANLGLSTVLLEQGEAAQAVPYAQRAVRAEPESGRARMHLGNTLAAVDRHEDAIVEYQQAADLFEDPDPGLLLNLAESLNQLGRYAEMVGALEQLVLIRPGAIPYERLGSAYFRLRRYDEALSAFSSSVNLDPNHYPGLNGVAVCELNNYLWSGKQDGDSRERAVDAMRRSLRIERQQPKIVELLRRYSSASGAEG
jgi:tetratricopeptide (TPR) repeat protein